MPIRLRLALAWALVATVMVVAGALLFHSDVQQGLLDSVDTGLRTRADQLVQSVRPALDTTEFADERTRLIAPREAFAQVIRPDGTVADASEAIGTRRLVTAAQLAAARRAAMFIDGHVGSERVRMLAAPVRGQGGEWVVIAGSSLAPTEAALAHERRNLVAAGVLIVLIGSVGSWLLAGAALRPVERMRRQALEMSQDDVAHLEPPKTRDELSALAVTLNELLDRLHASLAQQRNLVADASHELRTPLAVLRTELELALRPGRSREELLEALANAAEETDRLSRLAEDLLALGQHEEGLPRLRAEIQPLAPLLHASVDAARERFPGDVGFAADAPADLAAPVDGGRLRQAVDNLIDNAARVAPAGSTVRVVARRGENGSVVIEVADAGPGFPADFLPYAFDRFRRADLARTMGDGGTGLGLAIVKAIAEAHGGTAEAHNRAEGGAEIKLVLPSH